MRLVMGVSSDGYVSLGPGDRMEWLKGDDKLAFRLLTVAGSGVCGASARTLDLMPAHLEGRRLVRITRSNFCLEAFVQRHGPDCTLLGGQTLALYALEQNLVRSVHVCRSRSVQLGSGQRDELSSVLASSWYKDASFEVGSVDVETWRQGAFLW